MNIAVRLEEVCNGFENALSYTDIALPALTRNKGLTLACRGRYRGNKKQNKKANPFILPAETFIFYDFKLLNACEIAAWRQNPVHFAASLS